MSPMFGKKDEPGQPPQADAALQAEFDRVSALSLVQLASEVMTKGFGPGGPGADDSSVTVGGPNADSGIEVTGIADKFVNYQPQYFGIPSPSEVLWRQFSRIIAEGLQELEHASLVRAQMYTSQNSLDFTTTRLGRASLVGEACNPRKSRQYAGLRARRDPQALARPRRVHPRAARLGPTVGSPAL